MGYSNIVSSLKKSGEKIDKVWSFIVSILAAIPLFIGFWVAYVTFGNGVPLFFIALVTVVFLNVPAHWVAFSNDMIQRTSLLPFYGWIIP